MNASFLEIAQERISTSPGCLMKAFEYVIETAGRRQVTDLHVRRLLNYVCAHDRNYTGMKISLAQLASILFLSVPTCRRVIRRAVKDFNLLIVIPQRHHPGGQTVNRYTINWDNVDATLYDIELAELAALDENNDSPPTNNNMPVRPAPDDMPPKVTPVFRAEGPPICLAQAKAAQRDASLGTSCSNDPGGLKARPFARAARTFQNNHKAQSPQTHAESAASSTNNSSPQTSTRIESAAPSSTQSPNPDLASDHLSPKVCPWSVQLAPGNTDVPIGSSLTQEGLLSEVTPSSTQPTRPRTKGPANCLAQATPEPPALPIEFPTSLAPCGPCGRGTEGEGFFQHNLKAHSPQTHVESATPSSPQPPPHPNLAPAQRDANARAARTNQSSTNQSSTNQSSSRSPRDIEKLIFENRLLSCHPRVLRIPERLIPKVWPYAVRRYPKETPLELIAHLNVLLFKLQTAMDRAKKLKASKIFYRLRTLFFKLNAVHRRACHGAMCRTNLPPTKPFPKYSRASTPIERPTNPTDDNSTDLTEQQCYDLALATVSKHAPSAPLKPSNPPSPQDLNPVALCDQPPVQLESLRSSSSSAVKLSLESSENLVPDLESLIIALDDLLAHLNSALASARHHLSYWLQNRFTTLRRSLKTLRTKAQSSSQRTYDLGPNRLFPEDCPSSPDPMRLATLPVRLATLPVRLAPSLAP